MTLQDDTTPAGGRTLRPVRPGDRWARHGSGTDRYFHAPHTVASSVISHCFGRWTHSDPCEVDDDPPHEERCEVCTAGVIDVAMVERGLGELVANAPRGDA